MTDVNKSKLLEENLYGLVNAACFAMAFVSCLRV